MSQPCDPTRSWHPAVARLQHRRAAYEAAAARFPTIAVRDPRGGITTAEAVLTRIAETRGRITADEHAGSERHRRISRGQRWLLRLLPLLDGMLLFWFLTGVLNVDLRTFDPTVLIAAALALLCTVAVAAWTATVGEHLQRYKDARRNLVWGAVDGVSRGMLALTTVIGALLAAMMYVRVRDEVELATAVPGLGTAIVASALAAGAVLVNGYVLYLSFSDGSSRTRELDQLGRALAPHLRRRDRDLVGAAGAARRIEARLAAQEQLHRPVDEQPLRVVPDVRQAAASAASADGDAGTRGHHWRG